MEEILFNEIRDQLCFSNSKIKSGKMMSSEAIAYQDKVFAFFSRKKKMVVKLGKNFDPHAYGIEINIFNPFKKRGPLNGWFEIPFTEKEQWEPLAKKSLTLLKNKI